MTLPFWRKPMRPRGSRRMVAWYNPLQLGRTAVEVTVSTFFGRHSDHRLIEAVIAPKGKPWRDYTYFHKVKDDYSDSEKDLTCDAPRKEIIVDYVADTGDGWHSTYSMAYAIAHTHRCVPAEEESAIPLQRGTLLILGGDQVYPTASRKEYTDRLTLPYESALRATADEHPHVLAIPGNHDWYDSLVSFTRMFVSKEWFAGWFAPQDRSYFACKLPGGWWILGVDTQLGADIDGPQVEYFEEVARAFAPEDRVILCCAEPQWIYEKFYSKYDADVYSDSNLYYLAHTVLVGRVRVFVSGDLHHYRRHVNSEGVQRITCGGGGAFLHPTHAPEAEELPTDEDKELKRERPKGDNGPDPFKCVASYPSERTSWWLTWYNVLFPFRNWTFGLLTAVLYFITAWAFGFPLPGFMPKHLCELPGTMAHTMMLKPAAGFWALLMIASWIFFTDTHNKWYKFIAGGLHGFAHLLATVFVSAIAAWIVADTCITSHLGVFLARAFFILLGGWLFGGVLMGLYLLISLNGFGRHYTEAFSALAIPDYKCFLRFQIRGDGSLTIHPLKVHRVPRKWREVPGAAAAARKNERHPASDSGPVWEPVDREVHVELIEEPIRVTRGTPAAAPEQR